MNKNNPPVLVVFRKFQDEITALFPLEPGTNNPYDMTCYAHLGQHSAADMLWVRKTRLATLTESLPLIRELRQMGYNMRFGRRIPRNSLEIRRKKLAELGKS